MVTISTATIEQKGVWQQVIGKVECAGRREKGQRQGRQGAERGGWGGGGWRVVHHCERHKTTVHTGRRGSVAQTSPSSAHTRAKAATVEVTRSREREHDSAMSSRGGWRTPLWIPRDHSRLSSKANVKKKKKRSRNEKNKQTTKYTHLEEYNLLKGRALCRCRLSSPAELRGRTES